MECFENENTGKCRGILGHAGKHTNKKRLFFEDCRKILTIYTKREENTEKYCTLMRFKTVQQNTGKNRRLHEKQGFLVCIFGLNYKKKSLAPFNCPTRLNYAKLGYITVISFLTIIY